MKQNKIEKKAKRKEKKVGGKEKKKEVVSLAALSRGTHEGEGRRKTFVGRARGMR